MMRGLHSMRTVEGECGTGTRWVAALATLTTLAALLLVKVENLVKDVCTAHNLDGPTVVKE